MRLTDLQIKKLKPPEKGQKTHYDESLRGFGVRVSQGGSKSFVVMFGPRRQLRTIGRYPDIALADARKEARRLQAEMANEPPAPSIQVPRISFGDARDEFLRDSRARNKPSTAGEYARLLHKYFDFDKQVHQIARHDIMQIVGKLGNRPGEARHAFVGIRTMMNWCVRQGFIEHSPMPVMKFTAEPRTRILTDDELRTVWYRADEVGYPYGTIIQLLILTGQRRGEIAGLRRSWIESDLIVFPQGFTKNKKEHRVPIGPSTKRIIEEIADETDLLFPSRSSKGDTFRGWSKSKREFDQPIDVSDYVLHDLRRTYSSNLARLGVPIHVTERMLNHISGTVSGVAAVYNRYTYADEMRETTIAHEVLLAKLIGV